MDKDFKQVTFLFDKELKKQFQIYARINDFTMKDGLNLVVKEFLERNKDKNFIDKNKKEI